MVHQSPAPEADITQLFRELMGKCKLAHAGYWYISQTIPSPQIAFRCRQIALSCEALYFKLAALCARFEAYAFDPVAEAESA